MDKVFVGTVPSGLKFIAVERDGRRMPVLNGKGEVDFWDLRGPVAAQFSRAIEAMDRPERLRVINPEPSGRGSDGLYPYQREAMEKMKMGFDPAKPGSDHTAFWWGRGHGKG